MTDETTPEQDTETAPGVALEQDASGTDGASPVTLAAATEAEATTETTADAAETEGNPGAPEEGFPVVGIGASAGGLAAFETFFTQMPPDSGMAFVVVQHLHAPNKGMLVNLLSRYTEMPVAEITDGIAIEPNHVYVIPPDKDLALLNGHLHLMPPRAEKPVHLPIDYFFRSLAQDQGERAICVVLSGTGSDGTLGIKAVKEVGGLTMVQDPQTAEYDGMPRNAISSGMVDYVLPVVNMPQELQGYVAHAFVKTPSMSADFGSDGVLNRIYVLLRDQVGHDFSHYKESTIRRRVERRMAVKQVEDLDDYIGLLQQNPVEVETLFKELLIGVTSFFRDPEAFAALDKVVIGNLMKKAQDRPVRIWVPACATGEEAYSIAILLREAQVGTGREVDARIFATDIDADAIQTARAGVYPTGIAADVSAERLERFFEPDHESYRVKRVVREMLTFAEQSVVGDPPFSNLDLISCRNLLIYMDPSLQDRVIPLFHFALRPGGYLFLGTSESVGSLSDLFVPIEKGSKIFRRKEASRAERQALSIPVVPRLDRTLAEGAALPRERDINLRRLAEQALLDHYAPACAIVDATGQVRYFHGRTGKYLEPSPGEATLNILRMAREGLRTELASALRRALGQTDPIRYANLDVKTNGDYQPIDLTVRRVQSPVPDETLLMVTFEDIDKPSAPEEEGDDDAAENKDRRIADLERDLQIAQEHLQATIEELQTSNEELKSSNEELQSSNEELQSTNEELETSKEELQSMNEELMTANAELQEANRELARMNNDMQNLLSGTGVATVFLDEEMNIRRFTPTATQTFNLIKTDEGRPISHISTNLVAYDSLTEDAEKVLDSLVPITREVRARDGSLHLLRLQPYRTQQNVIEGVVLTLINVTELAAARRQAENARDYAENIVNTVREPLVVLDADFGVRSANDAFYRTFDLSPEETEGKLLYDLADGDWDIPALKQLLEDILPQKTVFNDYEVDHEFTHLGPRTMVLNARELRQGDREERLILLAIEDTTRPR